jgi:ATP-dependent Clp protease ATP-binding subunit ClpA
VAVSYTPDEVEQVANFQAYGFLPELLSRFSRFVPFQALDAATLTDILKSNVIDRLTREFEEEGFELQVEEPVIQQIVAESLKRETGARGLQQVLTRHIENAAFESFAEASSGRVRVYLDSGSIKVEAQVQGKRPKDEEPSEASPEGS